MSNIELHSMSDEEVSDYGKLCTMDVHRAIAAAERSDPANAEKMRAHAHGSSQMARVAADLLRHRADRKSKLAATLEGQTAAAEDAIQNFDKARTRDEEMDPPGDDSGPGLRAV